jgi:hypothetical protein
MKAKCEKYEAKDGSDVRYPLWVALRDLFDIAADDVVMNEILAWMRSTESGFAILEGRGTVTLSCLDLFMQEMQARIRREGENASAQDVLLDLGLTDDTRRVKVHMPPDLPPDSRECVVQVKATGEWLLASFTMQPGRDRLRWVCTYAQPVPHLAADDVIMWVALRDLFAAER